MRALVRYEGNDRPLIGVLEDGQVTPVQGADADWPDLVAAWLSGTDPTQSGPAFNAQAARLLPPLTDTSRIFCVAQNYPSHAAEAGGSSPPRPVVFLKPPSAFVGHDRTATIPAASERFDYEGELALIIGTYDRDASATGLPDLGIAAANDASARDLQPATLADRFQVDWFAAKCSDSASSLGPGIARLERLSEIGRRRIRTYHNEELVQDDTADSMTHSAEDLIEFVAQIVTLRPGDVLLTGTPAGVGKSRNVYVKPGDDLEVAVSGVASLRTTFEAPR